MLAQDNSCLVKMKGEGPSRWGANGSANNVYMFQHDKMVSAILCDAEKLYAIVKTLGIDITESVQDGCRDAEGHSAPVVYSGGKYIFKSCKVPSIGYKTYEIAETTTQIPRPASTVKYSGNNIILENEYYSLSINTLNGLLENIADRKTRLSLSGDFIHVRAYEDLARGAGEKTADWKLLDETSCEDPADTLSSYEIKTLIRI